jgi:hypothetical protein
MWYFLIAKGFLPSCRQYTAYPKRSIAVSKPQTKTTGFHGTRINIVSPPESEIRLPTCRPFGPPSNLVPQPLPIRGRSLAWRALFLCDIFAPRLSDHDLKILSGNEVGQRSPRIDRGHIKGTITVSKGSSGRVRLPSITPGFNELRQSGGLSRQRSRVRAPSSPP